MRNLSTSLAAVVAGALLLATGCTISGNTDATLLVVNESDFVIEELYLTDVGSGSWGRNLLEGDVLYPDEELLIDAECGYYDALLVDEEGVDCEIRDIDLCLNDATWVIRNNTCTVFEAARKAREQAAAEATRPDNATPPAATTTPAN